MLRKRYVALARATKLVQDIHSHYLHESFPTVLITVNSLQGSRGKPNCPWILAYVWEAPQVISDMRFAPENGLEKGAVTPSWIGTPCLVCVKGTDGVQILYSGEFISNVLDAGSCPFPKSRFEKTIDWRNSILFLQTNISRGQRTMMWLWNGNMCTSTRIVVTQQQWVQILVNAMLKTWAWKKDVIFHSFCALIAENSKSDAAKEFKIEIEMDQNMLGYRLVLNLLICTKLTANKCPLRSSIRIARSNRSSNETSTLYLAS